MMKPGGPFRRRKARLKHLSGLGGASSAAEPRG